MSLVKVDKDIAKNAAMKCIESIENKREILLQKEIDKTKNNLISKLFRRNWTDEQFRNYIISSYYDFPPKWKNYGWSDKYECEEIIKMCKISYSQYIYLDEEKADIVHSWK